MGHMLAGHHTGKITATTLAKAKSGTVSLVVSLTNEAGDYANKRLYFSEKALDWTRKQLKSCGFTGDDVSALHESGMLVGNEVEFDIETEVYDGEESLKVGLLFDVGGAHAVPGAMTAEEAKAFGATLKGRFGGAKGDQGGLDDIPF